MSICYYPNCNEEALVGRKTCPEHFEIFLSPKCPTHDPFEWFKSEYERLHQQEAPAKICLYPDCQEIVPPENSTFCVEHCNQFINETPVELTAKDWVESERLRLAAETPVKKVCMYPDCTNHGSLSTVHSNKNQTIRSYLCSSHMDRYLVSKNNGYAGDNLDWLKLEYENLHPVGLMPEYVCAVNGCGTQRIPGSDFCCEHAPCEKDSYINSITDLINIQKNCEFGLHDRYNRGLLNGLMLALSCITGEEPAFVDPIELTERGLMPTSILLEAHDIVNGARATDYGDAVESFKRISILASAMSGRLITPLECCLVLKGVKLARQSNQDKRDNLVDECGYAELEYRIRRWMANRAPAYENFLKQLEDMIG